MTPPADIDAAIEAVSTEPLAQVDDIVAGFDEDSVELMAEEEEDDIDLEQMAGESPAKYQNELIDEKDSAFMKGRLLGKSVADPPVFDHEVDAITQATMSSELIFDTVRRLQKAFESLPAEPDGTEGK